jgi:Protein of unknown function (DUF3489)
VFTIDSDLTISYHSDPSEVPVREDLKTFSTLPELSALLAGQTRPQLAGIWNSFAGVAPFGSLRPIESVTHSPADAIRRIWDALQLLVPGGAAAEPAEQVPEATKAAAKAPRKPKVPPKAAKVSRKPKAPKPTAPKGTSKKETTIAMISRENGASVSEIAEATGWQNHSIRGFVSTLNSKGILKTTSEKSDTRGLVYRAA